MRLRARYTHRRVTIVICLPHRDGNATLRAPVITPDSNGVREALQKANCAVRIAETCRSYGCPPRIISSMELQIRRGRRSEVRSIPFIVRRTQRRIFTVVFIGVMSRYIERERKRVVIILILRISTLWIFATIKVLCEREGNTDC